METTKRIDEIPAVKKGQLTIYKTSDSKRWGLNGF